MLDSNILVKCFYLGLFGWYKHALDMIIGGNFLECEDTNALNTINDMVRFLSEDNDKNTIHDKLDKIIELVGKSKLVKSLLNWRMIGNLILKFALIIKILWLTVTLVP